MKLCEKLEGADDVVEIKRSAWDQMALGDYSVCYFSGGCFYANKDYSEKYPFDISDMMADDWMYREKIWRSK